MSDIDLIREYFEYRDGKVFWKKAKGHRVVGDRFGGPEGRYWQGRFNGKALREHSLVWLLFNDSLPTIIDHIDGNGRNNRIENLRASDYSKNAMNSKLHKKNKTGHKGVSEYVPGIYQVRVNVQYQLVYRGFFEDLELACLVADEARDLHHGEFARHK